MKKKLIFINKKKKKSVKGKNRQVKGNYFYSCYNPNNRHGCGLWSMLVLF